jgi:hypothetical protein
MPPDDEIPPPFRRCSLKPVFIAKMYPLMSRVAAFSVLLCGFVALTAHRPTKPAFGNQPFPVNSTIAHYFLEEMRAAPGRAQHGEVFSDFDLVWGDSGSVSAPRILLLNYSAYDSAYANKMHRLVQRQVPTSALTDFWDGSADDLSAALSNQDIVVIAYPSGGAPTTLKAYGKVLGQFVRQGGAVVLTGTHEFGILQHYGLFDLDYGYFCADPSVHESVAESPLFTGTLADFTLRNYAYPLDVSDPNFVTLADVRGYPVVGYKPLGAGKVVYLGLEFYYDEAEPNRILSNTLQWLAPPKPQTTTANTASANNGDAAGGRYVKQRREEVLYAGSGAAKNEAFDLKIYPNPYVSKATLDIELNKASTVSVEMSNETGQIVAVVLPRKNLAPGFYRLELPNLPPGVYFVQCRSGEKTTMKKVVKAADQ